MKRLYFFLDLAQIRALVESTGMLGGSTCPSCEMPFDKGKKRRLIDSCGHERCYSCLFRSEVCPLCLRGYDLNEDDGLEGPSLRDVSPLSTFAPTDGWLDESSTVNSLCGSPRLRTKITTRANLSSRVLLHVSLFIARKRRNDALLLLLLFFQMYRFKNNENDDRVNLIEINIF